MRGSTITLVLAALLLTVAVAGGRAAATAPRTLARGTATIASATTTDFRVAVVAHRSSGGAAPSAAATLTSWERRGDHWQRSGTRALAGTYFWKTLTGARALCDLRIVTAARSTRPHVVVQLLVTPSLGCGKAQAFELSTVR